MSILVTGGTGYIGSHTIVELAEAGYDVVNIDNLSNSEAFINDRVNQITGKQQVFVLGDVKDEHILTDIFSEHKIEAVIHFAAFKSVNESVENPDLYHDNNVGATKVLLKVMNKYSVKNLVFSSSCTVYGQPDKLPVTEESPIKEASSPYGHTKQICEELIIEHSISNPGFRSMILRYFNPIGAHMSGLIGELPKGIPNNLVPYITQTASGLRDELLIFGDDYDTPDGTCIRDYIHVTDLAKAHVASMKKLMEVSDDKRKSFIYNVGTGKGNSVLEMVSAFKSATGLDLKYSIAPRRKGDIEQIWADVSKVEVELGWKATYNVLEAMGHAWKWEQSLRNSD